jgi:hypothetical protein
MGHAARQFRDFGNEDLVLVAPIDDDLILVHVYFPYLPTAPNLPHVKRGRHVHPLCGTCSVKAGNASP